jgi:hypothetical protein
MKCRLIFFISCFGLLMGIASIAGIIRMEQEGRAWLVIALVSAAWIALQAPDKPFAHGFVAGLIAGAVAPLIQASFFPTYLAHDPVAAASFRQLPAGASPRLLMLMLAPMVGLFSGLTLGLLAWAARKALRRHVPAGA